MKLQKNWVCSSAAVALAFLGWSGAAIGQTFSSGSTGADGELNLTAVNTTTPVTVRAGGVYHYTTVNIGATHTLRFNRGPDNAPVVILATGDVTITGTIDISGNPGAMPGGVVGPQNGALGGPGGFNGGNGGIFNGPPPAAGQGPGGGAPSLGNGASGGTYAASSAFVALTPLFGGSGGGGGGGSFNFSVGGAGGGGGGAILIASNTRIVLNGTIRSNGGDPLQNNSAGCHNIAAAGAGGAIRLVAPEIVGAGHLRALRGIHVSPNSS